MKQTGRNQDPLQNFLGDIIGLAGVAVDFDSLRRNFEDRMRGAFVPPHAVNSTETSFTVLVEVPGAKITDLSVEVDNGVLVVEGTKPDSTRRFVAAKSSIEHGDFTLELPMPFKADSSEIHATLAHGILTLNCERSGRSSQSVKIEADEA